MVKIVKVLICGMKGVGKTAILEQLIYGNVTHETIIHGTIEDTYVASIDTGRGPRDTLRLFDTAGIQSAGQLPKHYMLFPDAYILVYDPNIPESFDIVIGIKNEIDRNKDKKEVSITVLANVHNPPNSTIANLNTSPNNNLTNLVKFNKASLNIENIITRANSWSVKERVRHCIVNAIERNSLYDPFVNLAIKLYPPPNKSTFPLGKLTKTKNGSHS